MLHEIENELVQILPTVCPSCMSKLSIVDDLHLLCTNEICPGSGTKKLSKALEILDLKGLGPKMAEKLFECGFHKIEDILDLENFDPRRLVDLNVFKPGKTLDNIYESVCKLENIDLAKLLQAMQFEDVGKTLSQRLAEFYSGQEVDFSGFTKTTVARMTDKSGPEYKRVQRVIDLLEKRGGSVSVKETKKTESLITFEMSGEPVPFRQTKKDFYLSIKNFGYEHTSLTKDTKLLIVNDLSSSTGKIKKAKKYNTLIKTYEQVLKDLCLI